jgi:tRNA threonylcarbamoyladenosine biosynthesis protein TsaB
MLILAFDTTSEHGGVGVFRELECLATIAQEGSASYSVTLFEMVERLMSTRKLSPDEVELFAVANGPGSFTGIRVGVAAAQGWAQAYGRPVASVSVLAAMVEEARPAGAMALPIMDARRGEFFVELFLRRSGDDFTSAGEGRVLGAGALRDYLEALMRNAPGETVTCVARLDDATAQQFRSALPNDVPWTSVPSFLVPAIARLAWRAAREGKLQSPAELDAYYIRRTDAEMHWSES